MKLLKDVLLLGLGASIGGLITCSIFYKKHKKIEKDYKELIDEFKDLTERFTNYTETMENIAKNDEKEEETDDLSKVASFIDNAIQKQSNENRKVDYTRYSHTNKDENKFVKKEAEKRDYNKDIYIVNSDDECLDNQDYENITLKYYPEDSINDSVFLLDEDDEFFDDFEQYIGRDWIYEFMRTENDVVYVRNDMLKCNYEILRSF